MKNKDLKMIFLVLAAAALMVRASSADIVVGDTEDPMKIGVGARLMGMGKAFIGVADDSSAMFVNPAGLAENRNWCFMTMYANVLNDVPYYTLNYTQPIKLWGRDGGWGMGFVGSGVYQLLTPTQQGFDSFNYRNNIYIFSLANRINETWSLGGSLKFFDEGYTGSVSLGAWGRDLDLGIKYNQSEMVSMGLTLQNILPSDMGGKVEWQNGYSENIPAYLKVGGVIRSLDAPVQIALDHDVSLERKVPPLWHLGIEWGLSKYLVLRGGIDQALSAEKEGGVASNPTFGVGLSYWEARVDYAYHPYFNEESSLTHFISISISPDIYFKVVSPEVYVSTVYYTDRPQATPEVLEFKVYEEIRRLPMPRIYYEIVTPEAQQTEEELRIKELEEIAQEIAEDLKVEPGEISPEVTAVKASEEEEGEEERTVYHVVKSGESLWAISKKYYGEGSLYKKIMELNKISSPDRIRPGQKLKIDLSLKKE